MESAIGNVASTAVAGGAGAAAFDAHALLRKEGADRERRQERSQITAHRSRGTITARSIVRARSEPA